MAPSTEDMAILLPHIDALTGVIGKQLEDIKLEIRMLRAELSGEMKSLETRVAVLEGYHNQQVGAFTTIRLIFGASVVSAVLSAIALWEHLTQ